MSQLQATANLSIIQGSADAFVRNEHGDALVDAAVVVSNCQSKGHVRGVVLADGSVVRSKTVVLTTGTFLGNAYVWAQRIVLTDVDF